MKKLIVYVDGASQGNPGPSGVGVVIYNEKKEVVRKTQKYIGEATNNIAEYSALIHGLKEAIILKPSQITVYTDSELIANQMNNRYKVKNAKLQPLYQEATHLLSSFDQAEIVHIYRSDNQVADVLAFNAVRQRQR